MKGNLKFNFGDKVRYAIADNDEDGDYVMRGVSKIVGDRIHNGKRIYDMECSLSALPNELKLVNGQLKNEGFLREHGFKRKYSSDKSAFWMQRNVHQRTLLKNLHISVERDSISVWCEDIDNHQHCIIYKCKFSKSNTEKVLNFFT